MRGDGAIGSKMSKRGWFAPSADRARSGWVRRSGMTNPDCLVSHGSRSTRRLGRSQQPARRLSKLLTAWGLLAAQECRQVCHLSKRQNHEDRDVVERSRCLAFYEHEWNRLRLTNVATSPNQVFCDCAFSIACQAEESPTPVGIVYLADD